jgi:hypothetical protein
MYQYIQRKLGAKQNANTTLDKPLKVAEKKIIARAQLTGQPASAVAALITNNPNTLAQYTKYLRENKVAITDASPEALARAVYATMQKEYLQAAQNVIQSNPELHSAAEVNNPIEVAKQIAYTAYDLDAAEYDHCQKNNMLGFTNCLSPAAIVSADLIGTTQPDNFDSYDDITEAAISVAMETGLDRDSAIIAVMSARAAASEGTDIQADIELAKAGWRKLTSDWGPGDNGKQVEGGIYYHYKFLPGPNGQKPEETNLHKDPISVGYLKGTWKGIIDNELSIYGIDFYKSQVLLETAYPVLKLGKDYNTKDEFWKKALLLERGAYATTQASGKFKQSAPNNTPVSGRILWVGGQKDGTGLYTNVASISDYLTVGDEVEINVESGAEQYRGTRKVLYVGDDEGGNTWSMITIDFPTVRTNGRTVPTTGTFRKVIKGGNNQGGGNGGGGNQGGGDENKKTFKQKLISFFGWNKKGLFN